MDIHHYSILPPRRVRVKFRLHSVGLGGGGSAITTPACMDAMDVFRIPYMHNAPAVSELRTRGIAPRPKTGGILLHFTQHSPVKCVLMESKASAHTLFIRREVITSPLHPPPTTPHPKSPTPPPISRTKTQPHSSRPVHLLRAPTGAQSHHTKRA